MQIIVRKPGSEVEHKKAENAKAILQHYYGREIRDGSRFRVKNGATKEAVRRVYAAR